MFDIISSIIATSEINTKIIHLFEESLIELSHMLNTSIEDNNTLFHSFNKRVFEFDKQAMQAITFNIGDIPYSVNINSIIKEFKTRNQDNFSFDKNILQEIILTHLLETIKDFP